jgi:Nucleotidyl transferase AbiEii toxin, Type IV TA system
MLTLAERVVALDASLDAASIAHAFGGALALAFHVGEPRATRDIDLNVFVVPEVASDVFAALPEGVRATDADVRTVERDGQVRVFWDETPLDLFFSTHPFHTTASLHVERVPFAGTTIPVLGATELVVFKAFFNRTRDWADIETMVEARTPDVHAALGWLVDLMGPEDPRIVRLRGLLDHRAQPEPRFGT